MNTLKANNYDQAVKELESIEKGLSKNLNAELHYSNQKAYNVILCKRQNVPSRQEYVNSFVVQTYHQLGYEKIKDGYHYLGFNKVILLHDPNKKVVEKPKEEVKPEQAKLDLKEETKQ